MKRKQRHDPTLKHTKAQRRRKREVAKVRVWKKYLAAAKSAKGDYDTVAKDVLRYFKGNHSHLKEELKGGYMDFSSTLFVSVNKAAQAKAVLGPHLYQSNPRREVLSKTNRDAVQTALTRVLKAYLNYTPRESHQAKEVRKFIDDALLRGRGFLQTGYDDEKGIVTSWYVSSAKVLIDPDAECLDEAKWIAVQRREPVWELKRRIKDAWRRRNLAGNHTSVSGIGDGLDSAKDMEEKDKRTTATGTNDLVEYWVIWSKMGNGLTRGIEAPEEYQQDNDDEDFVRLEIAPNHDVPLDEDEWEVPLYLDKEWPLVAMDFVETLDQLWPVSVMAQALPHQKALDVLATLELIVNKVHTREIVFVDAELSKEQIRQIQAGPPTTVVKVKTNSRRLQDMIYRFETGAVAAEIQAAKDWHERELSITTGLLAVLHGGNAPQAQDRSATASQLKSQAANARLQDMRDRLEEALSDAARHEALSIRLPGPLDADDVQDVVRDLELGFLVSLKSPIGGEVPVRAQEDDEDLAKKARRQLGDEVGDLEEKELAKRAIDMGLAAPSLDLLAPAIGTYFPDQETAQAALQMGMVQLSQKAMGDPTAAQVLSWVTSRPDLVSVRPVTVEDVWRDTSGISPRDMVREYSYEVVTGSTQKLSPERRAEHADHLAQNVMPVAVQNGQFELVNAILGRIDDAYDIPEEERLQVVPPAPPPQEQPVPAA